MNEINTNVVEQKRAESKKQSIVQYDVKGFIKNYLFSLIFIIGIMIFLFGSLGLYITKVAESNILPDDIELSPFTSINRNIPDIPIDIYVQRPKLFGDAISQKATFNQQSFLDSFDGGIFGFLRKRSLPTKTLSNTMNYLSQVYENVLAKNYAIINTLFGYLSYLPESFIMIICGLFGIFAWGGLYLVTMCLCVFYHFIEIPQLFRNPDSTNKTNWENKEHISYLQPLRWLTFFFCWIPLGVVSSFVSPFFVTLCSLFSPFYATYETRNDKQNKTVWNFLLDNLVYKKSMFFLLGTFSLISNGFQYLGPSSLIGIFIAIAFAYFMGLYNNELSDTFLFDSSSSIYSEQSKQPVQPKQPKQPVQSVQPEQPKQPVQSVQPNKLIKPLNKMLNKISKYQHKLFDELSNI